jgi:hypothetical protein
MKKTLSVLFLAAGVASAQTSSQKLDWNGADLLDQAREGVSNMPAVPAPEAAPAVQPRKTGPFNPGIVNSVEAFAVDQAVPAGLEAIMNRVYYSAGSAEASAKPKTLRVASWNVNDPRDASKIEDIASVLKGNGDRFDRSNDKVEEELAGIAETDVFMLQDVPLPAAVAAAKATGYSVVWAPEFLVAGDGIDAPVLTGNAILSRYALSGFQVLRFQRQTDRSNEPGRKSLPLPEKVVRVAALDIREKAVLGSVLYGGRIALSAQAAVPYEFADAKGEQIAIVDIHLESAAKADVRRDQMAEVVDMIGAANRPTVFGGDLNTTGGDGRTQTPGRFLSGQFDTKTKIAEKSASVAIMVAGAPTGVSEAKMAFDAWKYFHNAGNPTSVLNREHRLFDDVKRELGVAPVNEQNSDNVKKYKNTWSAAKPRHVGVAVVDFMWVYDPMGNLSHSESRTYAHLVRDSAEKGAKSGDFLSEHFPIATTVSLTDRE